MGGMLIWQAMDGYGCMTTEQKRFEMGSDFEELEESDRIFRGRDFQ